MEFKLQKDKHILDTEYVFGGNNGLDVIFWICNAELLEWCRENDVHLYVKSDDLVNQFDGKISHRFVASVEIDYLFSGFFYSTDELFTPVIELDGELATYFRMVFE